MLLVALSDASDSGLSRNQYMKSRLWREIKKHKYLFLLLLPAIIWYLVFCYLPMYGAIIAFKELNYSLGIMRSPWVGLKYFRMLFGDPEFFRVFTNQLSISISMLITNFPIPVVLALMLNEIGRTKLKRFFQTAYTFPHFISWVVVSALFFNLLSTNGAINQISGLLGLKSQNILMDSTTFRLFLYFSHAWKEAGWGTIIYLAAITGVDPELYQAAEVDGAGRWKKMLNITWPGIRGTVSVLLVLAVGGILTTGFDQILNLYNPLVMDTSDIIDTYVYRTAILSGGNFSYTAALGLFKSVITLFMISSANFAVKKMGEEGIL